jgi:hypothetical protein
MFRHLAASTFGSREVKATTSASLTTGRGRRARSRRVVSFAEQTSDRFT